MTLTELFTQIANAIREKKGTTESIVAENFPEEIESIESGGKFVLPEGTHLQFNSSTFSEIDLSNCDTSNVVNMSSMFSGCSNLTNVNLSSINTENVTNMNNMFSGCTNLTTIIGIENLDLSELTYNNTNLFDSCPNLTNETLNNILKALSTITYIVRRRTLARQGFTSEQAEICTTLSNWAELETLGWTTGY